MGFETAASRVILEKVMQEHGLDKGVFLPEEIPNGGLIASPQFLFGFCPSHKVDWCWSVSRGNSELLRMSLGWYPMASETSLAT
ncbi:MAG: hypothetical protein IRZ28_08745 [Steroidobacteraceae bacterium]|nr:hypothetical protein [Steroidobacteraceae bacterium]